MFFFKLFSAVSHITTCADGHKNTTVTQGAGSMPWLCVCTMIMKIHLNDFRFLMINNINVLSGDARMLWWLWCCSGKQTPNILKEAMQYQNKYKYTVFKYTVYNSTFCKLWHFHFDLFLYDNVNCNFIYIIVSADPCQYSFIKQFLSHSNGINPVIHLSFRISSIPLQFLSEDLWIVFKNSKLGTFIATWENA